MTQALGVDEPVWTRLIKARSFIFKSCVKLFLRGDAVSPSDSTPAPLVQEPQKHIITL